MGDAAPRFASVRSLPLLLLLLLRAERPQGTELTFELPHSAKQCFHEDVERGVRFSLEYQVISGGHYDVDCSVEDPLGNTVYQKTRKQYDSFTSRADVQGVYQFCFSNEFSTFSHKTVYFDLQVGDPDMENRVTALTQMESACVTIHEALRTVVDSQTHYRLREAQDRTLAQDLHSRVSYWSLGKTIALFVVSVSQVLLIKSFFTEKRPVNRAAPSSWAVSRVGVPHTLGWDGAALEVTGPCGAVGALTSASTLMLQPCSPASIPATLPSLPNAA